MIKIFLILALVALTTPASAATLACAGASNTVFGGYVTEAQSYCKKIGDALGFDTVINYAESGARFNDRSGSYVAGIRTQVGDAITNGDDYVLIACCANDQLNHLYINLEDQIASHKTNIGLLIDDIQASSIKPIFISEPFYPIAIGNDRLSFVNDAMRVLVTQEGYPFVDVFQHMLDDSRIMTDTIFNQYYAVGLDGHLGVTGHDRVASYVISQVPAIVESSPPPPPPSGEGEAAILDVAISNSFGSMNGYTFLVRAKQSQMTIPDTAPTKIRVTFQARSNEPFGFAKAYIGHAASSGDAFDAASLTELLFSSSSGGTVPQSGQLTSDWLTFTWDRTTDLVIKVYANGGSSADALAAEESTSTADTYTKSGDSAATANDTGMTAYTGWHAFVTKIETDGFDVEP